MASNRPISVDAAVVVGGDAVTVLSFRRFSDQKGSALPHASATVRNSCPSWSRPSFRSSSPFDVRSMKLHCQIGSGAPPFTPARPRHPPPPTPTPSPATDSPPPPPPGLAPHTPR